MRVSLCTPLIAAASREVAADNKDNARKPVRLRSIKTLLLSVFFMLFTVPLFVHKSFILHVWTFAHSSCPQALAMTFS